MYYHNYDLFKSRNTIFGFVNKNLCFKYMFIVYREIEEKPYVLHPGKLDLNSTCY